MPDGFALSIDTREVDEALAKLPLKVSGEIVRSALQAAGDVMLAPMKVLCPERTDADDLAGSNSLPPGVLRESLTTQVQIKPSKTPRVKVGPPAETSHVAWWIENGFDSVKGKRHIAGRHFMAAAFDESAAAATEVLLLKLSEALTSGGKT